MPEQTHFVCLHSMAFNLLPVAPDTLPMFVILFHPISFSVFFAYLLKAAENSFCFGTRTCLRPYTLFLSQSIIKPENMHLAYLYHTSDFPKGLSPGFSFYVPITLNW